jgi:hypothetical protein
MNSAGTQADRNMPKSKNEKTEAQSFLNMFQLLLAHAAKPSRQELCRINAGKPPAFLKKNFFLPLAAKRSHNSAPPSPAPSALGAAKAKGAGRQRAKTPKILNFLIFC